MRAGCVKRQFRKARNLVTGASVEIAPEIIGLAYSSTAASGRKIGPFGTRATAAADHMQTPGGASMAISRRSPEPDIAARAPEKLRKPRH
jgi:hypothetical protein